MITILCVLKPCGLTPSCIIGLSGAVWEVYFNTKAQKHKSLECSASSWIFAANQDTAVLLCDKRDVYISSTATMNSRTAIVMRENALKLSVNEIVLIQRYWDMI